MRYNFVADSFHTKKLCSRLSSSELRFYRENDCFAFLSFFWRGGGLRLIGKRVVDFLLVLIELSLGVTAEALRAIIG